MRKDVKDGGRDGEESRRVVQSSTGQGEGGENDSGGGLEEKCSVFFFLLKVG